MINIDKNGYVEDYHIILCKRNHDVIGELVVEHDSVVSKVCENAKNELSFKVYKYVKDKTSGKKSITPYWDDITDFKYVKVIELDEYYEITVEGTEEDSEYKSVTCTSACEAELSNCKLFNIEINSEDDIKREDYKSPTIFYSELEPENSLLNRILYKLPQYSIGHVDNSLRKIQRTFSVDNTDVYSFLTDTVANEVGCLFTFDSNERTINAYDLKTVCIDCGYRGEYTDACPKCGSTNLKFYGEDTTVYIDSENLAENITHSIDTDNYKNCFKLRAGDDNMTAAVINCNPNGTDYLYYFSDECKKDMSNALVEKIESYDKLVQSYTKEYSELMQNLYEYIDKVIYYTSSMMPKQKNDPTDAKKEGAKLTAENLSPLGMPELLSSTSVQTVNTAIKQYAKVFIKCGYFKAEVDKSDFYMNGVEQDGTLYGTWTGNFIVTNYSDEEDTYTTPTITVKVTNKYYDFLQQKIDKKLKDEDNEKEGSIYDVLSIKDLADYKEAIKLYGLNRLKSFADAFQGALDIMIESDQANKNAELYEELYVPYYDKLVATNSEIDARSKTIKEYEDKFDVAEKRQREIQKTLNFESYLGDELYKEFVLFRREDEYSNENYISDGLENNEIFKRAQDFIDAAKDELYKSGEKQHKISASMANLLAIKEFEPLREHFKLGNFIRVKYDDQIFKLRLISYQITFGEGIKSLDVEFSDVTKVRNGTSDLQSVLKQAQSISSTYDSVKTTVKKTSESDALIRNFVGNGLDATTMKIVNNANNQNMVINDSGLLMRRQEEFSTQYENCQLKIINNGLYLTQDNWRSTDLAVGKYIHINPETGKQEVQMGVLAKDLVGQLILGNALGIYSEDGTKEMSFDNFGLKLNVKKNETTNKYTRLLDIQKDGESQLWIDEDGNIVLASNQIIQMGNKLDRVVADYADIEKLYVKSATLETLLTKYAKIDDLEAFRGEFKKLVADDAQIKELEAGNITIAGLLKSQNAEIENIKATKIEASDLEAYKATIEKLLATYATIEQLEANYIKAKDIEATYAKLTELDATNANIEKLNAITAEINKLIAKKADIDDLNAVTAQIETLNADLANINELVAKKVDADYVQAEIVKANKTITDQLDAINATIDNLDAKYATIEQLNAAKAELDELIAKKATIEDLNAAIAKIGTLTADLANINTILSGSIGTGNLQTIHLTADNATLSEAFIKELIAANINVGDLKAGNISTDRFTIKSDDGGIQIVGSTQQFTDKDGNVRMQVGRDAQGNFNFIIRGADGKTALYDENGIKAEAVPDGLIIDKMVADNANIAGSKLDINSVVDKINEDGTTSIKSNKVWIDEENQSLGASFNQIREKISATIKNITSYFVVSDSNNEAPQKGWSEVFPTKGENQFVWRKDLITKTDGSQSWTAPYVVTGDKGKGISDIKMEYAISESSTEAPTEWSDTKPEWTVNNYLWIRNRITYTNPTSVEYTLPYCDTTWEAINSIKLGTKNLIHNAQTMIYGTYGLTTFAGLSTFVVEDGILKISSLSINVKDDALVVDESDADINNEIITLGGK